MPFPGERSSRSCVLLLHTRALLAWSTATEPSLTDGVKNYHKQNGHFLCGCQPDKWPSRPGAALKSFSLLRRTNGGSVVIFA
uniref:Putative secreted protein n=1 Tax=Anopheles darlingi TaxID=43151 RepID=A0A2M4DQX3_ANODA